jgi:Zn-dependent protease with chaperone function
MSWQQRYFGRETEAEDLLYFTTIVFTLVAVISFGKMLLYGNILSVFYFFILLLSGATAFVNARSIAPWRSLKATLTEAPPDLVGQVVRLSTRYGVVAPRVMLTRDDFRTFSISLGSGAKALVVPEDLLRLLNSRELTAVIAHELYHVQHNTSFRVMTYAYASFMVSSVVVLCFTLVGIMEFAFNYALAVVNISVALGYGFTLSTRKYPSEFREKIPPLILGYAFWSEEYLADVQALRETDAGTVSSALDKMHRLVVRGMIAAAVEEFLRKISPGFHETSPMWAAPARWSDLFRLSRGVREVSTPPLEYRLKFLSLADSLLNRSVQLDFLKPVDCRSFEYRTLASIIVDPLLREYNRIDQEWLNASIVTVVD